MKLERYIVPLRIKHVNEPRSKSSEGWDRWKARLKKVYPVYYFLNQIIGPEISHWGRKIKDVKWWFLHRLHPGHRYHVMHTRLKPDYYCFDTVLLHAAFERFCDEYPHTKEIVALEEEVEKELDRLYDWWKKGRPVQEKEMDQALTDWSDTYDKEKYTEHERALFKLHLQLEEKLYNDDMENLISLVRLKVHVSW